MNALSSQPAAARKDFIPKARPVRILYAEDMRDLREIARMSLSREGHTIDCVADGSLALEILRAAPHSIDLLLTDHHMPVMNGLALVTALRATPFSGKVIVFSSELNAAVGNQYRNLSVNYILQKPVFPSDLRRVIADLFPAEPGTA